MKQVICFVLAALMVLSMTGCGQSGGQPSAATEPATKVSTEAATAASTGTAAETIPEETEPEENPLANYVEQSLAAGCTQIAYPTFRQYETMLNQLGYTEYRGDMYRPTEFFGVTCRPTGLSYNEEVFRMDFDFLDYQDIEADLYNAVPAICTRTGASLYGMRSAPEEANISPYLPEDFDFSDSMSLEELLGEDAVMDFDFVQIVNYFLEEQDPLGLVTVSSYFYPGTGNLYNLTYRPEDPLEVFNFPRVLCFSEEELSYSSYGYVEQVNVGFTVEPGVVLHHVLIHYVEKDSGMAMGIYYEPGMTLLEWSKSKYAVDNPWVKVGYDGKTLFYDHQHPDSIETQCCLRDADRPIEEILIYDGAEGYLLAPLVAQQEGYITVDPTGEDLGVLKFKFGSGQDAQEANYPFEIGMTLADWCASQYNKAGWRVTEDNRLYSPEGDYYLDNAHLEIKQLGKTQSGILPTVTITLLSVSED